MRKVVITITVVTEDDYIDEEMNEILNRDSVILADLHSNEQITYADFDALLVDEFSEDVV